VTEKIQFEPQLKEYDLMFENEENHWWYKGLRQILLSYVIDLGGIKPKAVLDAGCGTGINMAKLRELGTNVTGMDIHTHAIEYCKARGMTDVTQGSITAIPFGNETFDCVYSSDVIGCLSAADAATAVKEFARCLKPSGRLVLNAAALPWLFSTHDVAWDIKKRYTANELRTLLEKNGFRISKITYRVFLLFPPVVIKKMMDKIFGFRATGDLEKVSPAINSVLTAIMTFENFLLKYVNLPIGSSVFAVAQKV
jgi:ubiquinone/menaquinone biosynthesis C-methylase UbiE